MKPSLLICLSCCLLATVVPSVDGAKLDLNSEAKNRLNIWLMSRMKRDLNSVSALNEESPDQFVRPEEVKESFNSHSSMGLNVRAKRSKNGFSQAKRAGCSLGTCTVHDLAHRLHQLNNKYKINSAPVDKISPLGYGRRRRSPEALFPRT